MQPVSVIETVQEEARVYVAEWHIFLHATLVTNSPAVLLLERLSDIETEIRIPGTQMNLQDFFQKQ